MYRLVTSCVAGAALFATGLVGANASEARPVYVTVHLASDTHALAKIAGTSGLSHAERFARLRAAIARPAARRDVSSYLTGRGFQVVASSPFVVQAMASPAAVDATFPQTATGLGVPSTLAGNASFVVTSDEEKNVLQPLTTSLSVDGSTVRGLYDAPGGTPPSGHRSPAIATLQFSGWNAGDLTTFASDNGLADPVTAGRYAGVSVDGADPAVPDGAGGEIEVALDQESLLFTAPNAKQVAYFAPNSGGGIIDAIEKVATDAYNGMNIGALSISYGMCEPGLPAAFVAALHQALTDLVAVGVTVFAASGDSGSYECAPGQASVSSPASDPLAVAVGGTTVDTTTDPPGETVWWDGTNGSGGGTSTVWPEPAYQSERAPGLPGRGVPDISLDGDPATGMVVEVDGLVGQIGGTSLASPLAAATFTDLLSTSGTDYGIGDIHRNLYGAPASSFRDVTAGNNGAYQAGVGYDLASGLGAPRWLALRSSLIGSPSMHAPTLSNSRVIPVSVTTPTGMVYDGWSIGTGQVPANCGQPTSQSVPTSVRAIADGTAQIYVIGYTASGYCYLGYAKTRVDTVAPVAGADARVPAAHKRWLRFTWQASDRSPSTGVTGYRVTIVKGGSTIYSQQQTTKRSFTLKSHSAHTKYVVRVSAVDAAGNRSPVAHATYSGA